MPFSAKVGTKPRVEHTEAGRGCRGISEEEKTWVVCGREAFVQGSNFAVSSR